MPLFEYVGFYDRMIAGHGVRQGDRLELDEAPQDGMWVLVEGQPENTPVTVPEPAPAAPAEPAQGNVPEPAPASPEAVPA